MLFGHEAEDSPIVRERLFTARVEPGDFIVAELTVYEYSTVNGYAELRANGSPHVALGAAGAGARAEHVSARLE